MSIRLTGLAISVLAVTLFASCAPAAPAPAATDAPKPAPPAAAPAATTAPAPAAAPAASPAAAPAATSNVSGAAKPAGDQKAVADFYQGKTVRIIVGSAAGGGYDTYARVVAKVLPKYIPGSPTVIVENMEGAGSLRAANYVYKAAPKDGTVIGHIQGGLFLQQVLGQEGIEFDSTKWRVLGIPAVEKPLCVATTKSGFKSIAEAMNPGGRQFVVGGNAPGSSTWDTAVRLKGALDLNIKLVDGYDGTAKVRLAMDQGELDGICGWGYESLKATGWDRIQAGDYKVVAQVWDEPLKDIESAPQALQLAKTDEARQIIRLGILTTSKILRPFLLAPEVPDERAAAIRQAFDQAWKDPDFLAEAAKAKIEVSPMSGEEAEKLIRELFAMPEGIKARLKQINENKG